MSQAANRRTHARVPARLTIAAQHAGALIRIEALNIGEGGAYCRSPLPIPVMTRTEVRFGLPSGTRQGEEPPMQLEAVVVRCEPSAHGGGTWSLALFFPHPDDIARQRLARFVQARRRDGGGSDAPLDRCDG